MLTASHPFCGNGMAVGFPHFPQQYWHSLEVTEAMEPDTQYQLVLRTVPKLLHTNFCFKKFFFYFKVREENNGVEEVSLATWKDSSLKLWLRTPQATNLSSQSTALLPDGTIRGCQRHAMSPSSMPHPKNTKHIEYLWGIRQINRQT